MCWQSKKWLGEINSLVTGEEGGMSRRRQRDGEAEEREEEEGVSCARAEPAGEEVK